MPLRHTANQALTARATTAQPHHLGIGGGLVNEDQPGGRARATSARSCSAACRLFFESNLVTLKEAPDRGAAASNLVLAHRQNHFVQCQVRLLLNQTQQKIRMLLQW